MRKTPFFLFLKLKNSGRFIALSAVYPRQFIKDFYSPEREETSRSRNARLHPKGAYLSMQKNMALRSLFTFTNSGLLFSRTRRSKQVAKRAVYSLFPLSLSAKKQADREARGFVKGAYSRVRDRRQNASATKVCAAYSLSKPKGAYFCVSYRRQNAKATQYCEVYSRSENKSGVSERKEPILLSHRFFIHLKRVFPAHKGADEH